MIITEWLFREPNENLKIIPRRIHNPKPLREIARENIKTDDKKLNKELATQINNPYYFTDRILKKAFNIHLHSHHINHINSKLTMKPKYSEIDIRDINKILEGMATIYARLINQSKFKYQDCFQRDLMNKMKIVK